jgi:hypothetical protein
MSSFDKMFGWFPNSRREWIDFIVAAAVLLWLGMIAISEFELLSIG